MCISLSFLSIEFGVVVIVNSFVGLFGGKTHLRQFRLQFDENQIGIACLSSKLTNTFTPHIIYYAYGTVENYVIFYVRFYSVHFIGL